MKGSLVSKSKLTGERRKKPGQDKRQLPPFHKLLRRSKVHRHRLRAWTKSGLKNRLYFYFKSSLKRKKPTSNNSRCSRSLKAKMAY